MLTVGLSGNKRRRRGRNALVDAGSWSCGDVSDTDQELRGSLILRLDLGNGMDKMYALAQFTTMGDDGIGLRRLRGMNKWAGTSKA